MDLQHFLTNTFAPATLAGKNLLVFTGPLTPRGRTGGNDWLWELQPSRSEPAGRFLGLWQTLANPMDDYFQNARNQEGNMHMLTVPLPGAHAHFNDDDMAIAHQLEDLFYKEMTIVAIARCRNASRQGGKPVMDPVLLQVYDTSTGQLLWANPFISVDEALAAVGHARPGMGRGRRPMSTLTPHTMGATQPPVAAQQTQPIPPPPEANRAPQPQVVAAQPMEQQVRAAAESLRSVVPADRLAEAIAAVLQVAVEKVAQILAPPPQAAPQATQMEQQVKATAESLRSVIPTDRLAEAIAAVLQVPVEQVAQILIPPQPVDPRILKVEQRIGALRPFDLSDEAMVETVVRLEGVPSQMVRDVLNAGKASTNTPAQAPKESKPKAPKKEGPAEIHTGQIGRKRKEGSPVLLAEGSPFGTLTVNDFLTKKDELQSGLLGALRENGDSTPEGIRAIFGIPAADAKGGKHLTTAMRRNVLDPLVEAGQIVREGHALSTRYRLA